MTTDPGPSADSAAIERWADDHFTQGEVAVVMRLVEEFGWRPPSADSDAGQIEGLIAKWSGCWCETQMAWDHDPRVRDCPQHGSDDCRHMAEGIVDDLRALLATTVTPPERG